MKLYTCCWNSDVGSQALNDMSDIQATHWEDNVDEHFQRIKAIIMSQNVVVLIPNGKITVTINEVTTELPVTSAGELELDGCTMEAVPSKSFNPLKHKATSTEDVQEFFDAVLEKLKQDKDVLHRITQDDEFYVTISPEEEGPKAARGVLGLRPKPMEVSLSAGKRACIIL